MAQLNNWRVGFSILPFVVLGFLTIVAYHYQRTIIIQSYRKALEEKINKLANTGYEVLSFSSLSNEFLLKKSMPVFVAIVIFLLVGGIIWACHQTTHFKTSDCCFWICLSQLIFLLTIALLFLSAKRKTGTLAYEEAKRKLGLFNETTP